METICYIAVTLVADALSGGIMAPLPLIQQNQLRDVTCHTNNFGKLSFRALCQTDVPESVWPRRRKKANSDQFIHLLNKLRVFS